MENQVGYVMFKTIIGYLLPQDIRDMRSSSKDDNEDNVIVKRVQELVDSNGDVKQEYLPWGNFVLSMIPLVQTFDEACRGRKRARERQERKTLGLPAPPMHPDLLAVCTYDPENHTYKGPPQSVDKYLRGLIYDAMADGYLFDRMYIWNYVDSDYCF
jgi:hypothetical protein